MKHFIHEWENLLDCFYYSAVVEGWYKISLHKKTLDSLCDNTIRLLQPVEFNFSKTYKLNFLTVSYYHMKKILPKIKFLYNQKLANLDYHSSSILLKMLKKLDNCLLLFELKKANIFFFLDKKLGPDVSQEIFEYIVPV